MPAVFSSKTIEVKEFWQGYGNERKRGFSVYLDGVDRGIVKTIH